MKTQIKYLPLYAKPDNRHAMIQELKFKNFLSFRDEAVFSFEPTRDEPINRVATMADGTKLLRFAVVFGANASGKSNFLEALDFLRRFWTQVPRRNDLSTRVVPFLLDKNTPSEDSSFEMKFYVGDVRYWYKLSLNKERVSSESLYYYDYPSHQPTRFFWREYAEGQSVVKFNPAAVKLKAAEVDAINLNCWKNMSFFASMTKVNISIDRISGVIRWINEKLMPGINRSTELSGYAKEKMLKDEGFRNYLTSFIKTADLRIAEVSVKETAHTLNEQQLKMISESTIDEDLKAEILSSGSIKDIDTGFKVRVKNVRGEEEYILPESRQSDGTTRVIQIESAIYTTIKEQAFLHVDEVEASLHPSLLDFVLNEFLKVNDNRSQLLVTTHYDPLLDSLDVNDLFGKDSVWFTERKEDGNTELYPLTDFKGLSKLSSIRKSYKNGQFGAVPEIYI